MSKPRLVVLASGTESGGGTGFENLFWEARAGRLQADIVRVISNRSEGGVARRANRLGIKFSFFPRPWTAFMYQNFIREARADFVALSGWLPRVSGLDPRTTINIHPAPLPGFGGKGMYGLKVHEAVLAAYRRGEICQSEVCMHFVTKEIDGGPVFFRHPVGILPNDTPESLAIRAQKVERQFQAFVTNRVLMGDITWDGKNPNSLNISGEYRKALQTIERMEV